MKYYIYHKSGRRSLQLRKEAEQIYGISGMDVRKIGFICSARFDFQSDEYEKQSDRKGRRMAAIGRMI
ncbi:MAG: hypothetical protein U0L49_08305 [Eubacterium sp.]|nr:hypothetical protein [Eubacterium sp.]